MPFMMSDHLGDGLETLYKSIYLGDNEFGVCIARLVHLLGKLADAGMIANITRRRIENFFSNDMTLSDVKVISRNTSSVVLVNKKIHEQDSFELSEFITWITDEIIKDPIMKKKLCGRDNYEGVKTVLNSYGDEHHEPVMKENWVDFHIHQDKVFFTKRDDNDEIHLYIQDVKKRDELPFSIKPNKHSEDQLVGEGLLDGRIYHFSNGTVFVESEHGYIVRISDLRDGSCRCKRIEGVILEHLEDESLLYLNGGKIIRLGVNGREKVIIEDAILGMFSADGNEVYWKSRFRKKDIEEGKIPIPNESVDRIENCFKREKINEEILWKSLLFALYDFDNMEFVEKIGNRLRFAYFFDKLPVPFTVNEILNRLSEIEEYCYEDEVVKSAGYAEAMSYLMSIEKDNLDIKATFNALVFLLDNVRYNPYDNITDSAGIGVISSTEFFFGDVDEMDDELLSEGDKTELLGGFLDEFGIKEMTDRIDRRIAELEKAIEEEERKEREAEQEEKAKKKQNMKKGKERQDIERRPKPDEEKVERSAEGVNKNSED